MSDSFTCDGRSGAFNQAHDLRVSLQWAVRLDPGGVLAVAVGIYLPLELSSAIFVGGMIAHFAQKAHAKRGVDGETSMRRGMLFAAGLITGEALVGIFMAIPIVKSGNPDVFALGESMQFGGGIGLIIIAVVAAWLYRVASTNET